MKLNLGKFFKYIAMDSNGTYFLFEQLPKLDRYIWSAVYPSGCLEIVPELFDGNVLPSSCGNLKFDMWAVKPCSGGVEFERVSTLPDIPPMSTPYGIPINVR